jgi:hypothetical protein
MKRTWLSLVLLFLGAFLITIAAVCRLWAADAAERTPLNSYNRTYLTGEADKLDPATGEVEHFPVKITNITQVDPDRSDGDVVVFVTSTCVNRDEDSPEDCLTDDDPRMVTVSQSNFATDRHTGEAVDDPKYVESDVPIKGLVNKWPFHTQKKDYLIWDDLTQTAVPAKYSGEKEIQGLDLYQFDATITDAPIDLGNDIAGVYNLQESWWIDPVTGKIVDQQLHDVRTLADGGSTALDLTARYTAETVATNVDDTKSAHRLLSLITTVIPLVGLVFGLLFLIIGLLLPRRARGATSATSGTSPRTPASASA